MLVRRILYDALQQVAAGCVFLGCHVFVKAENTEDGFVRAELMVAFPADGGAHAARQNAVLIGDGGDDARNQFILKLEYGSGLNARS